MRNHEDRPNLDATRHVDECAVAHERRVERSELFEPSFCGCAMKCGFSRSRVFGRGLAQAS